MAFKKEVDSVNSEPNVVPMCDVMLVLLIIFMVITPMLQKGVSLEMARTVNPHGMPDADKDDAVLVAVSRDGKIYLGKEQTELKDLAKSVRDMIAGRIDKTVYIKSDARAKFEGVVKAVNEVRSVGVDKVGLITEKVKAEDRVRLMMVP